MQFNISKAIALIEMRFKLTPASRKGLEELLAFINGDESWSNIRHAAYFLATTYHETAFTFQPIEERGSKSYLSKYFKKVTLRKRLGNLVLEDAWNFKGRGYVQLTGRRNYTLFSKILGIDLVANPTLAGDPVNAYRIAKIGMYRGTFTGVGFHRFRVTDFVGMRKIINGTDKAAEIASYATSFNEALILASNTHPHTPVVELPKVDPPKVEPTAPVVPVEKPSIIDDLPQIPGTKAGNAIKSAWAKSGAKLIAKLGAAWTVSDYLSVSIYVVIIVVGALVVWHYRKQIEESGRKLIKKIKFE